MFKSLAQSLGKIKDRITGRKQRNHYRPGSYYHFYSQLHLALWQSAGVA